jgi:hypothetical protein
MLRLGTAAAQGIVRWQWVRQATGKELPHAHAHAATRASMSARRWNTGASSSGGAAAKPATSRAFGGQLKPS